MSTSPTPRRRRRQRNVPPPATKELIQPNSPETAASAAVRSPNAVAYPPLLSQLRARVGPLLHERMLARLFLLLAIGFNLFQLYPEVAIRVPALNDNVLHLTAVQRAVDALASGQDPTDPWLGTIVMGFPLFHHYQHLPHVLLALVYFPLRALLNLADVFRWVNYLLLSLFPLAIYWSMRRFGFGRIAAALGGLLAPLISTNFLFGLEYGSYVWRGSGLYTQLWAMLLLPLALAQSYVTMRTGRGYCGAALLVAATLMSHLIYGYMAVISLGVFVVLGVLNRRLPSDWRRQIWSRAQRLALLLALVLLTIAYFVVGFLRDSAYMNRGIWEPAFKYDSYGYEWVLGTLLRGELFDFGRLPVLSLLAGAGLVVCILRWREERYRVPVALALVWLLLYFGRPTWGALMDLLPLSHDLHLHRLIAGVHLGGIFLMGLALALPWTWALAKKEPRYLLAPLALTLLVLAPAYAERAGYLAQNGQWMRENQEIFAREQTDLDRLVTSLKQLPPGRVYAGRAGTWGKDYRVGSVPMYALLNSVGLDVNGYAYHGLSLNTDIQLTFNDGIYEQYNLFNTRYVLTPTDWTVPKYYKTVGDFGRHRLYQIDTTGYFDLVGSDQAFVGNKDELYNAGMAWLNSGLLAAKQNPTLYLNGAPADGRAAAPLSKAAQVIGESKFDAGPARGSILSEKVETNAYQADVQVQRDSMLMLKATYHPNWHAVVDGVEVRPVMLMPSYLGVRLSPGNHRVRFEYQSGATRILILLLGLLVLGLVGVGEWKPLIFQPLRERLGWQRGLAPTEETDAPEEDDDEEETTSSADAAALGARAPVAAVPERALVSMRTKAAVYLLFLSVYLLFSAGHFFSTDHVAVYLTAQSLVERRDLAIKPINDTVQGRDGRYYARYQPAQAVLSIPLYLVGHFIDNTGSSEMKRYFSGISLGDWGGTVPIFFVSLFNQFITPLSCLLVVLFCLRMNFPWPRSLLVMLIFGLSTSTWVYAREYFQHPLESFSLLAAVYILFAHRHDLEPKHAALSGLALGLGVLTRLNVVFIVPVIGAYLFAITGIQNANWSKEEPLSSWRRLPIWGVRKLERRRSYLTAFGAPLVIALVGILIHNYVRFGSVFDLGPNTYDKGFSTPLWFGLYGYLLSVGRSIFLYSPPIILTLFTFGSFYKQFRREALLFAAIVIIYLVIYSTFGHWEGGWSWGPRYLLPIIPFMVLPLGYMFGTRRQTFAVVLLSVLGLGVQILGLALNYDFVYGDWIRMKLVPEDAFLYVPELSAIPTHFRNLLSGRHIDVWVLWVYSEFGSLVFLLTLAVPLALLVTSSVLFNNRMPLDTLLALARRRSVWKLPLIQNRK